MMLIVDWMVAKKSYRDRKITNYIHSCNCKKVLFTISYIPL